MQTIKIRQSDGTLRRYKNADFIPAFLMIPEVLLNRTNQEMIKLKRTPRALFTDSETMRRVESDNFLQVVIDAYAFLAWPYMGIHGKMEDYSGYDPFWVIAHAVPLWICELEELNLLPQTGDFYRQTLRTPDEHFGFTPDAYVIMCMETIVPRVMQKNDFDKMYRYIRLHRCHEDFGSRWSHDKANFYVRWYHTDTAHPTKISTEVLQLKSYTKPDFCFNPDGEMEEFIWDRVEAKAFWDTLSETDQKILWLRWNDMKMEDVAKAVGLSTHSAVSKRIQSIGRRYEEFTGELLGFRRPRENCI